MLYLGVKNVFFLLKSKKSAWEYCSFKKYIYLCTRKTKMGKSYTASSWWILQGLIAAKVVGCSGAI